MTDQARSDEQWMKRCFDLARKGIGAVSPNPPVGAVLVYNEKIIGEGYHPRYGAPHAEVITLQDVKKEDRHLIPLSTLYVSLEPCCIHGKTPPCTDLILREKIADVRVSTLDPNPKIAGKGLEILKSGGVNVHSGILEEEGKNLIRTFRKNILHQEPYIILKWAQSELGILGAKEKRVFLSHPYTATFSHKLRSECDAIMVGARTVMIDNPVLTTRDYPGRSPHRVIYDPNGTLNDQYLVFQNNGVRVFYFSLKENQKVSGDHIVFFQLHEDDHARQINEQLFRQNVGTILVEGGAHLLGMFITENLWDEAWVIRTKNVLREGIPAPNVKGRLIEKTESATDTIIGIENENRRT